MPPLVLSPLLGLKSFFSTPPSARFFVSNPCKLAFFNEGHSQSEVLTTFFPLCLFVKVSPPFCAVQLFDLHTASFLFELFPFVSSHLRPSLIRDSADRKAFSFPFTPLFHLDKSPFLTLSGQASLFTHPAFCHPGGRKLSCKFGSRAENFFHQVFFALLTVFILSVLVAATPREDT